MKNPGTRLLIIWSVIIIICRESGYTVIVLANRDQSVASAVATKIRLMLIGKFVSAG